MRKHWNMVKSCVQEWKKKRFSQEEYWVSLQRSGGKVHYRENQMWNEYVGLYVFL